MLYFCYTGEFSYYLSCFLIESLGLCFPTGWLLTGQHGMLRTKKFFLTDCSGFLGTPLTEVSPCLCFLLSFSQSGNIRVPFALFN